MKITKNLSILILFLGLILLSCQQNPDEILAPNQTNENVSKIEKFTPMGQKVFPDITLTQWYKSHKNLVWDLTECDLTLSYTLDMSGQVTGGWTPIEVGLRDLGYPDIDPNGHGGFMWSNWQNPATNPNSADIDDHHILGDHGWALNELQYNVNESGNIVSAFGSYNSYAFWFDRDGVDQWQADMWQYKDGITYNTNGIYDIVIVYKAANPTTGTMMATINDEAQGFIGFPPARQPVGRSFTADMSKLQVFYGRGGGDGDVLIKSLTVNGCLYSIPVTIDIKPGSDPNSINLKSNGVVSVAVLTTTDLNVADINPATVTFADASPLRWSMVDVDDDGDTDMVFKFKTQELNLDENSISATLTGETNPGQPFEGFDSIRIVPKEK